MLVSSAAATTLSQLAKAEKELKLAQAALQKANETKEAAEESSKTVDRVNETINEVVEIGSENRRLWRNQDYTEPANCAEFNSMIGQMNEAMKNESTESMKKGIRIGNVIAGVNASSLKCSAEELNLLT